MDELDLFNELMEQICDNCLAYQLINGKKGAEWVDICTDCRIEAAVEEALEQAHRDGVSFACGKMLECLKRSVYGKPAEGGKRRAGRKKQ